ncbi:MAG: ABC transporter ATP-binding protein [Deltaproteobacteria bacterium]|nr:ABC transporter ATP-binding protein [Deltaproteobacteria bacterium]
MHVVDLEDVKKSFAKTGPVLENLNLSILRGQFVCFLGPSGCGKSTVLRLIAGLEKSDSGRVSVQDDRTQGVSFVFQEPHLLPWRTTVENVMLPLELRGRIPSSERFDIAVRALEKVGLGEALQKRPHELSGGMKMRVSLARALVTNPGILLLDEPFAALDEVTRFQLQEDLLKYWDEKKMTVVFVTHSISEAAFLAQRQIVFSKRPARMIADRMSRLPSAAKNRNTELRLSAEFLSEIRELSGVGR